MSVGTQDYSALELADIGEEIRLSDPGIADVELVAALASFAAHGPQERAAFRAMRAASPGAWCSWDARSRRVVLRD